ncbi:MAG: UDP-N-acetylglucosamine 2-epimerase, partial [Rhodospirillaceae bacterium]
DSGLETAQATGRAIGGIAEALAELTPDIVLVLGDRFEILAAGLAARFLNIPLGHVHGGELTQAAIDDSLRHALTKMAALHFVAAEPYAARVRQMGEDPASVFVVGAPGLDHLTALNCISRAALANELSIDLSKRL